jgi:LmbE family N-acetylglucosaminyl deacetylase
MSNHRIVSDEVVNARVDNVLMLVAHPDDESLFGFYDLIRSNCTILCFTNEKHPVRAEEFSKVLFETQQTGRMFNYKDASKEQWKHISNDTFIETLLPFIRETKYDRIVSHDKCGEYGHKQHIRVHSIAVDLSKRLQIPFSSFEDRFDVFFQETNSTLYNDVLTIYKSEQYAVSVFRNFFYDRAKRRIASTL